uniref:Uncharacterized protein n=1 Tax=Arundo donax TaxID=35708 RepID=A0A0A9EMS4_ARUDO
MAGPGSIAPVPLADMPEATPSASSKPMATNRRFGSASMSPVTTPARYLA